ncbi:MAG TPA: type II toxin-antitoxin system HicA family toxin [Thermoguttaceae bacterium]|nr:type II toxin-antitoxin system HicA family toxin [Thermoguttaceae bacterium]
MSPKLPILSGREVYAALSKVGFSLIPGRGKGSHLFVHRSDPPAAITIPNDKEIKRGTLRAILRQADLTVEDFLQLL